MFKKACLMRISTTMYSLVLVFMIFHMTSVWTTEDDNYEVWIRGSLPANDSRILKTLRERFLDSPSSLPYNFSTDPYYIKYSKKASWDYIDHYLKQFFANQTSGFFVEAGALDGEFLSNTLWLEQTLGWKGLLVEPDEDSYRQLLQKHRRAWSSNTCLSNSSHPKETVHVAVRLNEVFEGVPWYYRGASHELGITMPPNYDLFFKASRQSYAMVQCFPLASFLWALNVTTVDFLSLDIQGTEEAVLKSFPWKDFTIKMIAVELSDSHHNLTDIMKDIGYTWLNSQEMDLVVDYIFVRDELLTGHSIKCFRETLIKAIYKKEEEEEEEELELSLERAATSLAPPANSNSCLYWVSLSTEAARQAVFSLPPTPTICLLVMPRSSPIAASPSWEHSSCVCSWAAWQATRHPPRPPVDDDGLCFPEI
ncbi:uncharacterized protein LOC135216572 [Macrobrachium nipponense]|uniref:uncharacterized protein LOC135216572 n=1 Tax=Macrobrachium nipponense TaxID=159736 RepID=UPI0030C8CA71